MALVEHAGPSGSLPASHMEPTGLSGSLPAETTPSTESTPTPSAEESAQEEEPVIDIVINNVVCNFSVSCDLDLKYIAQHGDNVEYRRENGMVTMKLRRPYCTASIWSSGKVTCTGSTSEAEARQAGRRVARYLQKTLEYQVRFRGFRIVNVLGTCSMPFSIRISDFAQKYPKIACYEPELHPGVTYRINHLKATLKVFSTGSITVTAPCVAHVQQAIEHVFPLVYEFRKDKTPADKQAAAARARGLLTDSDSSDAD